jgi:TIR domain
MTHKNRAREFSYDVFLSHSNKDRSFVTRLAEDLSKAGLRVWLDQWHIKAGYSFAQAIDDAMRGSRFLIIVMSPDYFQSAWTTQEWQSGLAEELEAGGVRLIPILYRDCTVPPMLSTKLWVDFRDTSQYQPVLARLVRDLHELASGETPTRRGTEEPKPGERVEQLDAQSVAELKKVLQDAVEAFRAQPRTPAAATSPTALAEIDESMCFIVMPFGVESLGIVP